MLEKGTSHIGSAEGQTIRLDFGDASVSPERHAALIYDEGVHAFILAGGYGGSARLNGKPLAGRALLRDGDVFSLGGTSLRLVALCGQNFNWGGGPWRQAWREPTPERSKPQGMVP